jgi:hypothetical protein
MLRDSQPQECSGSCEKDLHKVIFGTMNKKSESIAMPGISFTTLSPLNQPLEAWGDSSGDDMSDRMPVIVGKENVPPFGFSSNRNSGIDFIDCWDQESRRNRKRVFEDIGNRSTDDLGNRVPVPPMHPRGANVYVVCPTPPVNPKRPCKNARGHAGASLPPMCSEDLADAFNSMNVTRTSFNLEDAVIPKRPAFARNMSPLAQQRIQSELVADLREILTHLQPSIDQRETIIKVESAANLYLDVLRDVTKLADTSSSTCEVAFEQLLQRGREVSVDCSPFRDQCSLAHQCRSISTLVRVDFAAATKFGDCKKQLEQVARFCKQLRSFAITRSTDMFELFKGVQAEATSVVPQ